MGPKARRPRRRTELELDPWVDGLDLRREKERARGLRRTQWWKRQVARGTCHYCGGSFRPDELTMDHVVPLVRGGKSTRSNCVPCCRGCNTKKQSLLPVEWEEYLESLKDG